MQRTSTQRTKHRMRHSCVERVEGQARSHSAPASRPPLAVVARAVFEFAPAPSTIPQLYASLWRHAQGARVPLLGSAALLIASQLVKLMAPWAAARAIDTLQQGGARALMQAGLWVAAVVLITVCGWTLHGPGRVLERKVGVRVKATTGAVAAPAADQCAFDLA